jgi:metal-dependent HD superfamily phosphatase/phosphodiesterase
VEITERADVESELDKELISLLDGTVAALATDMLTDSEILFIQQYANHVSINRLQYNDHGPVHMRRVAINAVTMAELLHKQDIPLNLEKEGVGSYDDSRIALLLAGFLHDIGMTVGRDNHEESSIILALPFIDKLLEKHLPGDSNRRTIIRSMVLEGILGHMTTKKVYSLEAGIILVADGCDMEKGRARIPVGQIAIGIAGDIHMYSSAAIEKVSISMGEKKPIRITVLMSESVGFFQVEEVLLHKLQASSLKDYIELYAGLESKSLKCYLD